MIGGSAALAASTGHIALEAGEPPGGLIIAAAGLLALGLIVALYWVVGHAMTVAHESGHAIVGTLLGNPVKFMQINPDISGLTRFVGDVGFLTAFAGYTAPSVFGLLGAFALSGGNAQLVLWISVVSLLTILVNVKNPFGWLVVIVTGLVLILTARSGSAPLQTIVACVWVWLLLLGGPVHVARRFPAAGDHKALFGMTWIPKILWFSLHLVLAVAALFGGVVILFGLAD